ncbi:MAG TPA: hypothetical protein VNC78_11725 [Actinomycetota bacterium]|nr:hypothetical protein [Actinomycetota bacterium]
MHRARALLCIVIALAAVIPGPARAKPATEGTWTFTDLSPDPTSTPEPAERHCHGQLPSAPGDVNSYEVVLKKTSRLVLTSHNLLDWAMELHDADGEVVFGTDGGDVNSAENLDMLLEKGKYTVVYCNLEGEPEITVDWAVEKA